MQPLTPDNNISSAITIQKRKPQTTIGGVRQKILFAKKVDKRNSDLESVEIDPMILSSAQLVEDLGKEFYMEVVGEKKTIEGQDSASVAGGINQHKDRVKKEAIKSSSPNRNSNDTTNVVLNAPPKIIGWKKYLPKEILQIHRTEFKLNL